MCCAPIPFSPSEMAWPGVASYDKSLSAHDDKCTIETGASDYFPQASRAIACICLVRVFCISLRLSIRGHRGSPPIPNPVLHVMIKEDYGIFVLDVNGLSYSPRSTGPAHYYIVEYVQLSGAPTT